MPPPARPQSAPPAAGSARAAFSFRGVAERPAALRPSAPLSEELIHHAWATLTGGRAATAHLSPKALLERLRLFQPTATAEDAALLLGGEPVFTREMLCMLLLGNRSLFLLFDPLAEALGAGALGAPGELSFGGLRRACEGLPGGGGGGGGGALTEAAWQVLLQEADADRDGRLQLEDVRALLRRHGGT
jgi:hypothetical protein